MHFDLEDILCKLSNQSINAPQPRRGGGSLELHTSVDKIKIKGDLEPLESR